MRLSSFCAIASALLIRASPLMAGSDTGYLAATFNGGEEQVFFQLASATAAQSFRTLNDGKPYLVADQGTTGARDPSILVSHDSSTLYILATDLKIASTNWDDAQRHGSRSIHVWQSTDGLNWSIDRLATLMPATAGYVWAPSAVWDPESNSYAVFWSSVVYAPSDVDHTGEADGPYIWYSHTGDFRSFTPPQRWDPVSNSTSIDQEIQQIGASSYVRYLSDTQLVRRVVLERSDNGLFGHWQRIGVPVDKVREGPASFRDINNPNRYFLWEDDYGGSGYECYYTEDFAVPFTPCPAALSPSGMRHGSVVTLDSARYLALSGK